MGSFFSDILSQAETVGSNLIKGINSPQFKEALTKINATQVQKPPTVPDALSGIGNPSSSTAQLFNKPPSDSIMFQPTVTPTPAPVPQQQQPLFPNTQLSTDTGQGKTWEQLNPQEQVNVVSKPGNFADLGSKIKYGFNTIGKAFLDYSQGVQKQAATDITKTNNPYEKAAISGLSGTFATPAAQIGGGLQSLTGGKTGTEAPQIAKGATGLLFGGLGATGGGALFNAVMEQPEVKAVATPVLNYWDKAKQSVLNAPLIKELPQEAKDLVSTAADLAMFKLLHEGAQGIFKTTVDAKLPDPITPGQTVDVKLPTDRPWWNQVKTDFTKSMNLLKSDPMEFFKQNQIGMSIKDVSKEPIPGKGVQPDIIPTPDLRTFDFHELEGTPQTPAENAKIHDNIVNAPDRPMTPGGESFNEAAGRALGTIQKVMQEGGNTAVTTHNSMFGLIKLWNEEGQPDKLDESFRKKYVAQDNSNPTGSSFDIKGPNGDITVVRHGETEDNANGLFRSADTQLTDKGREQAQALADELKNKGITKIYSSDLPRAIDTSKIIQEGTTSDLQTAGPDQGQSYQDTSTSVPNEGTNQPQEQLPPSPEGQPQAESPSANEVKTTEPSVDQNFKYVKNEPVDFGLGKNDKTTATNAREEYAGVKNAQILRGNNLADTIRRMVQNETDRQGMFWYDAAKGDTSIIEKAIQDPRFEDVKPQLEAALKLPQAAKDALDIGKQYYNEAGKVSQEVGTVDNLLESYQNRIYKPEQAGDYVSTELGKGLKQTTGHNKQRIYDTEFAAKEAGKQFATTDYADALAIHNEEMTRVNTARKLADAMSNEQSGLGSWTTPDNIPKDWKQVGNLRKGSQIFVAPKGIADGLKPLIEPDKWSDTAFMKGIQKYQGLVKTVDLSFSLFHHLNFVKQALYSPEGWKALGNVTKLGGILDTPDFKDLENDFVRHTGITTQVQANQDLLHAMTEGDDALSKVSKLPVMKQIFGAIEKNNQFLFDKMQRVMKVTDYSEQVQNWASKHPDATNAEVKAAKTSLAKAVNNHYGGLNWEALGVTKTNKSLLRTFLLAPDWLTSNVNEAKAALTSGEAGGTYARKYILSSLVAGIALTEGINKLTTGHFTDKNPKGHELEIQVAPGVYISAFGGAAGELLKLGSNIKESGGLQGVARYAQGKLSPIARTGVMLGSGTDYTGRSIWSTKGPFKGTFAANLNKNFNGLMSILGNVAPVPFSAPTIGKYLSSGKATVPGAIAVGTGVGRYSVPPKTSGGLNFDAKLDFGGGGGAPDFSKQLQF